MDGLIDSLMKTEFVSVWVRDPRMHKEDFWHTHIDYEICLHTNSMCFRKKTSTVRRRYSEFVWLHQRLQENALLMELPKLPPWNPFFSLNNPYHVTQRMQGLQVFLEAILQMPLLLSDSRLHLFLQSQLSMAKMEACALGQTRYSVAQAVQHCSDYQSPQFPIEETGKACCDFPIEETGKACCDFPIEETGKACCDFDCESTTSSGLGHSVDQGIP